MVAASGAGGESTDPSMEDILASIRRILNEEPPTLAPEPVHSAGAPPESVTEPLVLTEAMLVSADVTLVAAAPAPPPSEPPVATLPDASLAAAAEAPEEPTVFAEAPPAPPEPEPSPAPEPVAVAAPAEPPPEPPEPPAPVAQPPVVQPQVSHLIALEAPMAEPSPGAALAAPSPPASTPPEEASRLGALLRAAVTERNATVSRSGPSIEDIVREELRPLLHEWLDQNLPSLVDRLARAEIERVVGRALS